MMESTDAKIGRVMKNLVMVWMPPLRLACWVQYAMTAQGPL
jgi:hypothetical protein